MVTKGEMGGGVRGVDKLGVGIKIYTLTTICMYVCMYVYIYIFIYIYFPPHPRPHQVAH